MSKSIQQALDELRAEPEKPVQVTVDGLTVEVRVVHDLADDTPLSAVFAEIGPWEGESTEEIMQFFREARREGGTRKVGDL